MERHGPFLEDPLDATADHQIRLIGNHRARNSFQLFRIIAAIAVQKYNDIGVGSGPCACQTRGTIASSGFKNDSGSGQRRLFGGPISGAVVDDDNFMNPIAGDGPDHLRDGLLFIESRYDDGYFYFSGSCAFSDQS